MKTARFRFDDKLQPLLPRSRRGGEFDYSFNGPQSLKHLIESLGIPHTELGEVRANGTLVGLGYLVHDGDRVEVRAVAQLNTESEPRFVLDGHLGRLTSHLRMLGLDCLYRNTYHDKELVSISVNEGRVLLSRDRRLLMHKSIQAGYLLRSLDPAEQLKEVVQYYRLARWVRPFQRCLRCNHPLQAISKGEVLERLKPLTKLYFDEFHICPTCNQIYWKGSHYDRMKKLIDAL
jgi:uncharacterized protein with PIN domain